MGTSRLTHPSKTSSKTNPTPRIDLRFGNFEDLETVREFIDQYWKKNHILAREIELLKYLYLDRSGRLNFVLAFDRQSKNLVAVLGFIPTNSDNSRVALALWKSRTDPEYRSLRPGLAVLRFLLDELSPRSIFSIGINTTTTRSIYEFLGFTCGVMDHHLMINPLKKKHKILKIPSGFVKVEGLTNRREGKFDSVATETELKEFMQRLNPQDKSKDVSYLIHRYLDHPNFVYSVRAVSKDSEAVGIIVTRRLSTNGGSCMRIIDIIGGESCLEAASSFLRNEIIEMDDEYLDLVSWGMDSESLERIGFLDRRKFGELVAPDHFSPFRRENSDLWFFANRLETERFFKGDGDQDRPN